MRPIYESDDLTIRPYQPSDADDLARLANNPKIAANLKNVFPHPYTRADADAWIAMTATNPSMTENWAVIWKNEFAGGIGLQRKSDVYERTTAVGYWLGEPFWGQGIATQAVQAVTRHAFADTRILRLEAGVYSFNPASARVLEKAGFVFEGRHRDAIWKNGVAADLLMYSRIRTD